MIDNGKAVLLNNIDIANIDIDFGVKKLSSGLGFLFLLFFFFFFHQGED